MRKLIVLVNTLLREDRLWQFPPRQPRRRLEYGQSRFPLLNHNDPQKKSTAHFYQ